MENYYSDYIATINGALKNSKTKSFSRMTGSPEIRLSNSFLNESIDLTPLRSLRNISDQIRLKPIINQRLGQHPDFIHLRTSKQTENHYIVSVFIDITNSTGLFKKYDLDTILVITNTIQRAAIHTCVACGGYIERLQGDGLFVYFGGKSISKDDAIRGALIATSMFTYFVKNDLQAIFQNEGVEDIISTKIGVDFGNDDEVLWFKAGIGECSEITTLSLHTSLASKMMGNAPKHGIVVGENIKNRAALTPDLYDLVKNSKGEVKRYIYEDRNKNLHYTQFTFDWSKFLIANKLLDEINSTNTGRYLNQSINPPTIVNSKGYDDALNKTSANNSPWAKE